MTVFISMSRAGDTQPDLKYSLSNQSSPIGDEVGRLYLELGCSLTISFVFEDELSSHLLGFWLSWEARRMGIKLPFKPLVYSSDGSERPFLPWGAFESTEVTIGIGEDLMTPFLMVTPLRLSPGINLLGVDISKYVVLGIYVPFGMVCTVCE